MKDQRKNITLRLHLPRWVAEEAHQMWDENAFLLARLLRDEAIERGICQSKSKKDIKSGFAQHKNETSSNKFTHSMFMEYRERLLYVRDYIINRKREIEEVRERVNFKLCTLKELEALSHEYHERLKSTYTPKVSKRTDEEGGHVFLVFPNGWYWVNLKKQESIEESQQMRHCGLDYNTELFSLRDKEGNSYLTMSRYKNTGVVNQFRGEGNSAPSKKYGYYIFKLLTQDVYPIEGFNSGLRDALLASEKFMPEMVKNKRIQSLVVRDIKCLSLFINHFDFKDFKDKELQYLIQKRWELKHIPNDFNIHMYRKIVKEGLHKKPWFNWAWIICDLIYSDESNKEDVKHLKEFNWFDNPNEDIGMFNYKNGTIVQHMIRNKRFDLLAEFESCFPESFIYFYNYIMDVAKKQNFEEYLGHEDIPSSSYFDFISFKNLMDLKDKEPFRSLILKNCS
jgi:hypothetical protein